MDKKNFKFRQLHKEEIWKYKKEKYVFRAELDNDGKPSLIEKPCDVLLVIEQQDQNIKQLHREQTKKNTIKIESASWARSLSPSFGKEYFDLRSLILENFTFILKCFVYMSYVLLFSCFYKMVFNLKR